MACPWEEPRYTRTQASDAGLVGHLTGTRTLALLSQKRVVGGVVGRANRSVVSLPGFRHRLVADTAARAGNEFLPIQRRWRVGVGG